MEENPRMIYREKNRELILSPKIDYEQMMNDGIIQKRNEYGGHFDLRDPECPKGKVYLSNPVEVKKITD